MLRKIVFCIFVFSVCTLAGSELRGLQFLINLINPAPPSRTHSVEKKAPTKSTQGCPNLPFIDLVTRKAELCPADQFESELEKTIGEKKPSQKRQPIKVKCIASKASNGTLTVATSITELIALIAPVGNSTKRTSIGSCALVLFYTRSCPGSAQVAPHFNALPRQFPELKIAAIDALKNHAVNSDFGIIGLPTIFLFHQGRPAVKYNESSYSVKNFIKFISQHTGIEAIATTNAYVTSDDFKGPLSNQIEYETDIWLWISWIFIIVCACYYFSKSRFYTQIVEMVKRNWRESEARHEHNN